MKEKVEVSVEFIKSAHRSACSDWKGKIERQFPDLFEKYKAGSKIMINGREFLLVNISTQAFLCNASSGNVWSTEPMDYGTTSVTADQINRYVGIDHKWHIISRKESY